MVRCHTCVHCYVFGPPEEPLVDCRAGQWATTKLWRNVQTVWRRECGRYESSEEEDASE